MLKAMIDLELMPLSRTLSAALSHPLAPGAEATLYWLGQAGFAVRTRERLLLVDPYLSDSLAKKYKGREFPHVRMMRAPVAPEELRGVDAVFCTHRHSDHMDPGTLPQIERSNPQCRFIVPRADGAYLLSLGMDERNVLGMDAGESLSPFDGISVEAIPSSHEDLAINARGEHLYLGFIIRIGAITLYHSGDCIPYAGLAQALQVRSIDLALLPINGRNAYLSRHGIVGNFSLEEAVSLCRSAQIPFLVCHHFGMFAFNTVDPGEAQRAIDALDRKVRCILASVGTVCVLRPLP
jgi:L-ascorbate metabolism protein UlaG (beta-lactamase superfamily)